MTINNDQLQQQQSIFATLTRSEEILKSFSVHPSHQEIVERLQYVLHYMHGRLLDTDFRLVSANNFNSFLNNINEIKNNLEAYAQNKDLGNLNSAINLADAALTTIAYFPPLPDSSPPNTRTQLISLLQEKADKIRKSSEDFDDKIKTKSEVYDKQLSDFANDINGLAEAIKRTAEDVQNKFNEKEVKITEELNKLIAEIGAQKTRLDELGGQFTKQFSDAQESRLNAFNADLTKWKEQIDSVLAAERETATLQHKQLHEAAEEVKRQLNEKVTEIITVMERQKDEAAKLLEVVGITTLSGHYKRQADLDRRMAGNLRLGAIYFMLMIPVIAYFLSRNAPVSWENIISHTLITLPILIPALYLTHESAKHRNQEVKIRRFELELAAISPYFEAIPDTDKKAEKRIALADSFFGHKPDEKMEEWQLPTMQGVATVLNAVAGIVEKAKK